MYRLVLVGCFALLVAASCNPTAQQVDNMATGPVVSWEALDDLQSEGLMEIGTSMEQSDQAGAIDSAKSEEFKAQVDAFEKSEAPSGVSEAQKAEIVKQLKALMESANGDGANFKTVYDQLNAAIKAASGG